MEATELLAYLEIVTRNCFEKLDMTDITTVPTGTYEVDTFPSALLLGPGNDTQNIHRSIVVMETYMGLFNLDNLPDPLELGSFLGLFPSWLRSGRNIVTQDWKCDAERGPKLDPCITVLPVLPVTHRLFLRQMWKYSLDRDTGKHLKVCGRFGVHPLDGVEGERAK